MNEFADPPQQSEFFLEQNQKIYSDELSFLNLHALNKSFHDKSSSSSDSSSDSESFDKSSESNPYGSSSSSSSGSSENIQEAIKERLKSQKLVRLHTGEKSIQNITLILQYFLEKEKVNNDLLELESKQKLIKKLNLMKFDIIMFYLIAHIKDREEDIQILFDKLKAQILDTREKKDQQKVNQMIYYLIEENKKKDKSTIINFIIDNASYLMKRVMEDKIILYEIFLEITQNSKINKTLLQNKLSVSSTTIYKVLQQKRYDQILYLVKNNIKVNQSKQITFKQQDRGTYEGYLNKPLQKINLKLVILFYLEQQKDLDLIKQLLFDVSLTSQEKVQILRVLIRYRANSIARDVCRQLIEEKYTFDDSIFTYSLEVMNYDFLWFLRNQQAKLLENWLNDEDIQQILIDQLYKAEGKNFEYLIYYLKNVKRLATKQMIKLLGETLIHRIEKSQEGQFIYTFYNPLKVSLLVCELILSTLTKVVHYKNILNKAHDLYYKFAQIFCFYTTDPQLMIELFKDIDLEKRKVVYLINENNSALILSTQIVEDAIESMWNGNIETKTNLFEMFSITQNLFYKDQCDYVKQIYPSSRDKFIILNTSYQNHHFSLQRVVWTYNCKVRNFLDQLLILILMALIFANFTFIFRPQLSLQNLLSEQPADQDAQERRIINELQSVYYTYQIIIDIIISLNFTFKPLFTAYYNISQKILFEIYPHEMVGFILGLLSIFQLIFIPNADSVSEPHRFKILLCFRTIYMGFVIFQCISSLKSFKLTGPMIRAMYQIILECNKFSFIFIMINLGFSFMAYFSFYQNENGRIKNLIDTILYLTEALFGQFSFKEFNQPSSLYGPIFLISYLFISPVIFMQLLVAVLTFTFEKASRSGRIHYNLSVIDYIKCLEYDSISGCLVTLPIVGSFLNVIYMIAYIFSGSELPQKEQSYDKLRQISKFLVKCGYFPIYVLTMTFSITINLACSPIFYVVNFFRIAGEKGRESVMVKLKRMALWLFFGYYFMIVQLFKDCKINHQYLIYGKYLNESEEETISNSTYSIVASVAKSLYLQLTEFKSRMVLSEFLNAVLKKIKNMEQKLSDKQKKLEIERNKEKTVAKEVENEINLDENYQFSNVKEFNKVAQHQREQTLNNFAALDSVNMLPDSRNINTLTMIEGQQVDAQNQNIKPSIATTTNFLLERDLLASEPALNIITEEIVLSDLETLVNKAASTSTKNTKANNDNNEGLNSQIQNQDQVLKYSGQNIVQENFLKNSKQDKHQKSHHHHKKKVKIEDFVARPSYKHHSQNLKKIAKISNFYLNNQPEEERSEKQIYYITKDEKFGSFDNLKKKSNNFEFELVSKKNIKNKEPSFLNNITDLRRASLFKDNKNSQMFMLETNESPQKQGEVSALHNPKLKFWAQLSKSQNDEEGTPIQYSKTKKTTYQMWKELKKEDSQNRNSLFKDIDILFQFLDAFVVEEEKLQDDEDATSNFFKNEIDESEITDMIYLENMLKLMYHYSKNDVKLARFNIVSQTIKMLFSGEWIQPDPQQANPIENKH